MPNFGKSVVWLGAVALTLAASGVARAQQDAAQAAMAACNVDENTTSAVQTAALFLGDALQSSGDSLKAIALKQVDKKLTDPADKNMLNQPGRAWEMGKAAVFWLSLDSQSVMTTRGKLGMLGGDPNQVVDLSVLADSSFKIVEAALPKCIPIVQMYREQNGWTKLIQAGLNEQNDAANLPPDDSVKIRVTYDSALTTIHQAARISPRMPYIGLTLGQYEQWKGNTRAAADDFVVAIEQTKRDTTFDPVRREIYEALGKMTLDAANDLTMHGLKTAKDSADKAFYLATAKTTFTDLAKEPGTSGGKIAADGLTAVAIQTGDTASIKASYTATLNNPDANYLELIKAGFAANTAADAGLKEAKWDEIKLFRRAGQVNPWGRDWLYNLSIVLASADSGVAARPLIDRLMVVDPGGVTNYQAAQGVYAYVQHYANDQAKHYNDLENQYLKPTDALKHKAYADSVSIWEDSSKVFATKSTDFLFKKDSIFVAVEVTGWVPTKDGGVQMGGTFTNRSTTAKSGTMHVEFLDHDGKTVSTGDIPIALDPKAQKDFTLTATGAGIQAFKYTLQY